MTDAQQLCAEFRALGPTANTWTWARRITGALTPIGKHTIGDKKGRTCAIRVFRCDDQSLFGFDMNGAKQVWAMPRESA